MKPSWLAQIGALFVLMASFLSAQTAVIFVGDDKGNVGRIVAGQTSGIVVGSLTSSGFSANQVIGLAYDSDTNSILLFDRSAKTVYTMNASTGVTSVLFTTSTVEFQGGAVYGGLVYGINENTQQLAAYTFAGVQQALSNATLPGHVHSLATNPVTKTLFYLNNAGALRSVGSDGNDGTLLLSTSNSSAEDVAYFAGNYLVATYDRNLYLIDGSAGTRTTYLTSAELTGIGVTGSVSGVVLEYIAVPEPSTWAMMLVGLAVIAWVGFRRRVS